MKSILPFTNALIILLTLTGVILLIQWVERAHAKLCHIPMQCHQIKSEITQCNI